MRVLIDGRWVYRGPVSGRRVLRSVLAEWATRPIAATTTVVFDIKDADIARSEFATFPGRVEFARYPTTLVANSTTLQAVARRVDADVAFFQYHAPVRPMCPTVTLVHDGIIFTAPENFSRTERVYMQWSRTGARRSTRVLTVSFAERDRLARLGFTDPDLIDVLHWAPDAGFRPVDQQSAGAIAEVRARFGLPERFVLYVGRMNRRKRIDVLCEALQRLGWPIPLVIVGPRDGLVPEIERYAEHFRELGFVSDTDLQLITALADVFVYPSVDEGFGLPVLEAMAAGATVVTTDVPALREVAGDGALLVPPDDPAALATAIDTAFQPEVARELRHRATARAASFTWTATCDAIEESLRRAVGEDARPRRRVSVP